MFNLLIYVECELICSGIMRSRSLKRNWKFWGVVTPTIGSEPRKTLRKLGIVWVLNQTIQSLSTAGHWSTAIHKGPQLMTFHLKSYRRLTLREFSSTLCELSSTLHEFSSSLCELSYANQMLCWLSTSKLGFVSSALIEKLTQLTSYKT